MPPTVLLVDDEPNVLTGLQRALRKEPYELLHASSVHEARTILRNRSVDVVIADQDMPDLVGTVFLAEVHREFPATERFILTGKSTCSPQVLPPGHRVYKCNRQACGGRAGG